MTRLGLTLMFVAYTIISAGVAFAQGALGIQAGTVRGQITDTTPAQNPIEGVQVKIVSAAGEEFTAITNSNGDYERSGIPAGRYFISIYKEGYSDRLGKPVTVVNGGDHFVPLKMSKKGNILTFFQNFGFVFWALMLCAITALLIFLFTKRGMREKSTANEHR